MATNLASLLVKNNTPKGIAWEGELVKRFFSAMDEVLEILIINPYLNMQANFSLNTADDLIINTLFSERNILGFFPQAISTEDQRKILKALLIARNWVTLRDLKEFMLLMGFILTVLDSFDVWNNPTNYPYLNVFPQNEADARGMLYYNLSSSTPPPTNDNKFPIPFPIRFAVETLQFVDYLLQSLIDAHIRLINYTPPQ